VENGRFSAFFGVFLEVYERNTDQKTRENTIGIFKDPKKGKKGTLSSHFERVPCSIGCTCTGNSKCDLAP
jgi:hypothetical protein